MSQKKTNGLKQTIRERLADAEAERDSALTRMAKAQHETKMARAESTRLRDLLRWNQGTQTRRFVTV